MAVEVFVRGLLNCIRPVIRVDATHCKGKYKGIMLVAMSIDSNKQVYPMTFGLSDKENDESWTWFMRRLQININVINEVVFVSDRYKSIAKPTALVFLDNFHPLCISIIWVWTLWQNSTRITFVNFMLDAKACRESVFQYYYNKLASYKGVQRHLTKVGLSRWARVYQGGYELWLDDYLYRGVHQHSFKGYTYTTYHHFLEPPGVH